MGAPDLYRTTTELVGESGLCTIFRSRLAENLKWVRLNSERNWEIRTVTETRSNEPSLDITETVPKLVEASVRFLMTAAKTLHELDERYSQAQVRCHFEVTNLMRMRLFTHIANDPTIQSMWERPHIPGQLVSTRLQGHYLTFAQIPRETYRGCLEAIARVTRESSAARNNTSSR